MTTYADGDIARMAAVVATAARLLYDLGFEYVSEVLMAVANELDEALPE